MSQNDIFEKFQLDVPLFVQYAYMFLFFRGRLILQLNQPPNKVYFWYSQPPQLSVNIRRWQDTEMCLKVEVYNENRMGESTVAR